MTFSGQGSGILRSVIGRCVKRFNLKRPQRAVPDNCSRLIKGSANIADRIGAGIKNHFVIRHGVRGHGIATLAGGKL